MKRASLLASLLLLIAPPVPGETPHPERAIAPDSDLGRLAEWFDAHPELESTSSSGWKPFNRLLWFAETRPVPEGTSAGILRRRAFDVGRERTATEGARGAGWFNIGPLQYSGRCVAIDVHPTDPDVVYVGSASGGAWKTTDGGDSWTPLMDDQPSTTVGAVCVLNANPDVVLVGTGEGSGAGYTVVGAGQLSVGLLKSTDGGATFSTTSLSYPVSGLHGFSAIEDNPTTGVILAGANDGLWRSTDQGDTWTQVQTNGNYFDVKWKPGDASRVYATKGMDPFQNSQTGGNGVRLSTDDGLTWTRVGIGQPPSGSIAKTKIGVTPADPSVIYAHYVNSANWQTLGVYRSTDDGANWQARNTSLNMTGGQGWYNLNLAVSPTDPDRIVTAGVLLYTSDDGGVSYASQNGGTPFGDAVTPHWDNHALIHEPGSDTNLWIGTDGGVWRSTDVGATWQSRREGIVSYQFYDICVAQSDPEFTLGGTQDNGLPGRNGTNWFESTLVADGFVCNINPNNHSKIYAEWQFGNQVKSTDAGQSWFSIQNGLTPGNGIWMTPVDLDQLTVNHLYTGHLNGIWRTTNGGNLWTNVAPHFARWIDISPVDGDVVWTVSNFSAVWHTTDDGVTWTSDVAFPATGIETKIHAHPTDVATAFVTYGGYGTGSAHVVTTTDFGATWTDVTGDFPDQPANTFLVDPDFPDDWYLGSDVGVWTSTDSGTHWVPYGTGLANCLVTDLEIRRSARKLVAGTYGRGAWEIAMRPLDPSSVAVGSPPSRSLMLDPPSPNPVRDRALLRFAARSAGRVALEIHDVRGRRVASITELSSGDGIIRNAVWIPDGAASGVYFAVLRAGSEQISRKIVVTR